MSNPQRTLFGVRAQQSYEGLMEHMVAQLGMHLTRRQPQVQIRHHTIERMMSRCASCGASEACKSFLAQNPKVESPPGYCLNARILMWLKDHPELYDAPPASKEAK